ncbi:Retrovirus-related Pol polyprotein from type-1 retrotransposable element [Trichinella spiralis]|uniref:Retrovirus-related Pol polyprotein from type-1 retrotransposable element n=1 Tax=Trichinella spiralis TaxID=6334 RepID=A0ABR3KMS1_TRISP
MRSTTSSSASRILPQCFYSNLAATEAEIEILIDSTSFLHLAVILHEEPSASLNRRKLAGHILDVASLEQFDGSIEEVSTHLEKILAYRPNSESVEYSAVNAEHGVSITHPILAEESADLPNSVKASRTIFLPKTDGTTDISKCRPITIASTMYRLLSKIITRRLAARVELKIYGIFENTSTLYALLKDAKARSSEICLAMLDLAKAFDSVPHSRILRALGNKNVDPESIDLILNMLMGSTYVEIKGLQGKLIPIRNGVRQGDPLSPLLFSLFIDEIIGRLQACGPAYDFHGEKICILAFADDLTLVADSAAGMKILLKAACDFLEESGMSLNAEKCRTLCISRSPRSRKTFVNPAAKFNISDWKTGISSEIPSLCATDTFRFLGHTFDGEGKIHIDTEEIRSMLKSVKSAPLKSEQKVALIRSHLLPRLQFLFSTAEADSRKAWLIDSIIRGCVKEILHSVKAGMCTDIFYIPSRDGGMGLTSLGSFPSSAGRRHSPRWLDRRTPSRNGLLNSSLKGGTSPVTRKLLKLLGASTRKNGTNAFSRRTRAVDGTNFRETLLETPG